MSLDLFLVITVDGSDGCKLSYNWPEANNSPQTHQSDINFLQLSLQVWQTWVRVKKNWLKQTCCKNKWNLSSSSRKRRRGISSKGSFIHFVILRLCHVAPRGVLAGDRHPMKRVQGESVPRSTATARIGLHSEGKWRRLISCFISCGDGDGDSLHDWRDFKSQELTRNHRWGAGIARWLEHRTRDWKVSGSNPCWNGGRIFFSRVDFLCWLLFRYPFHPRVTTVARKKSRSFCQKVQVAGYS